MKCLIILTNFSSLRSDSSALVVGCRPLPEKNEYKHLMTSILTKDLLWSETYLSSVNFFTSVVKLFDFIREFFKLWNDKLATKRSRDEHDVFIDGSNGIKYKKKMKFHRVRKKKKKTSIS